MTISIGTFDDLQPDRPQPIDRNPSIPCDRCGESYNWQDYWEGRVNVDTNEPPFWCDSCWGELIEQAKMDRHAEEHKQLTEWTA